MTRILVILLSITLFGCSKSDTQVISNSSSGDGETPSSVPKITGLTGYPTFASSPTLNWKAVAGSVSYEVGVGNNRYYDNVLDFVNVGAVTSHQFTNLNPLLALRGVYYLMVRSIDGAGNKSDVAVSVPWSPGIVIVGGAHQLPEPPHYPATCAEYLASNYYDGEGDGDYWLDFDGAGSLPPTKATCMMESNEGGWMLVLNYVHAGGTNPNVNAKTADLPLLDSDMLGSDESTNLAHWGHAAPAMMANVAFTEVMFHCRTSAHTRLTNFKSSQASLITYLTTGQGTTAGIATNFTPLTGHTAVLPAARNNGFNNQGDQAMTAFPFAQSGVAHWAVRGNGGRWECDDFAQSAANHTIHRIWVK